MWRPNPISILLCLALSLGLGGCSSVKKVAINSFADTLSMGGDVFTSDDDPELIGDALPFALKTQEMLLAETPRHQGLLLATCKGFTLYGFAFVELEADRLELTDYRAAKAQRQRASKLYRRAHGYCMEAMELRFPGSGEGLLRDPAAVLAAAKIDDVPLLRWTALSWGARISLSLDQPEVVIDLPVVRSLLERALELHADYDFGALHEAMIGVEGLPETMGGSLERARQHFARAEYLSAGHRAGIYVSWAESISVANQDRREFQEMLDKALAVDLDVFETERLSNIIQQRRARFLLDQIDDLFLEEIDDGALAEDTSDEPSGP